ncbi:hypothetical protein BU23DRAFT_258278 [Bimuria novae-zelandiae CBS 107.79]|uniref:Uncharacterized protein n=1 Tax=Bimuria novae-zelandiae CBS 107.79 TaxID=1447943 RepID=A0A6A5UU34_9PLEO|nr:hypothetical protein BU23DRAFT_258278 [Bimuria novae-zelandiae CBS 107.79]
MGLKVTHEYDLTRGQARPGAEQVHDTYRWYTFVYSSLLLILLAKFLRHVLLKYFSFRLRSWMLNWAIGCVVRLFFFILHLLHPSWIFFLIYPYILNLNQFLSPACPES